MAAKKNKANSLAAGVRGSEGDFIVLGAPDRWRAIDDVLAFQDTIDAAVERLLRCRTAILIKECIVVGGRNIAKKRHETDHTIVVEGDMRVLTFAQRVILWPSAVRILSLKDVIEAGEKRILIAIVARCAEGAGKVAHLDRRGAIVEGSPELGAVAGEFTTGAVFIFRPVSMLGLPGEDVVQGFLSFVATEPAVGLLGKVRRTLGSVE